MKAYHIDRLGNLQPGMSLDFHKIPIGGPVELLLNDRFPEGISLHGVTYLVAEQNSITRGNFPIESILEYERLLHFPDLPSRFQSMFACENFEEAMIWKEKFTATHPNCRLLEIEFDHKKFASLDASLINFKGDPLIHAAEKAKRYWSGELSSSPTPELLVRLPVKVVRFVDQTP